MNLDPASYWMHQLDFQLHTMEPVFKEQSKDLLKRSLRRSIGGRAGGPGLQTSGTSQGRLCLESQACVTEHSPPRGCHEHPRHHPHLVYSSQVGISGGHVQSSGSSHSLSLLPGNWERESQPWRLHSSLCKV